MSDTRPPENPMPDDPAPEQAPEEGRSRDQEADAQDEPIGFAPAETTEAPPVLGGQTPAGPEFQVISEPPIRRQRRAGRQKFDFGGVFANVFKVYGRHWISLAVLSLLFIGPFQLLNAKVQWDIQETAAAEAQVAEEYDPDASEFDSFVDELAPMWILSILGGLMTMVLGGSVAFLVVRHQQGRPAGVGEAIGQGISRLVPLALTMLIISGVVIAFFIPAVVAGALGSLGFALLFFVLAFIPLILYWLGVYIAAPVCTVEELGPMASVKRSWSLSKGNRGWIFLLYFVVAMIGGVAAAVVVVPFMTFTGPDVGRLSMTALLASSLLSVVFLAPLQAVACSLCYVELRRIKEGVDPDGLTHVFE